MAASRHSSPPFSNQSWYEPSNCTSSPKLSLRSLHSWTICGPRLGRGLQIFFLIINSRSVSVAIAMPALVSFSRANVGPKSRCFFCPKNATTFLATPSLVALHDTLPFNLWTTPIFPSLSTERLRFCACLTFNPRRMDASLLVISPSRQERMTSYLSCSEAVSLISSTAYVC